MLKLKNLDPKILVEDPEHVLLVVLSILIPFSPLSPEKAHFISQIVEIADKIQNHLFIYIFYHFTT